MIPVNYDFKNVYNSAVVPSTIHTHDNALAWFFKRYLIQKIISVFKFENLPEDWSIDYFQYVLFVFGYVAIFRTDRFGVIPQHGSLYGYDVFYRPTGVRIANPLIRNPEDLRIGRNCELIKMQPDYCGAWDIVEHYASLLALATESLHSNLVNSKFAYVFAAENKAAAESFKKLYDQISSGEPAGFIDKKLFKEDGSPAWEMFSQNLKQTYIGSELLEDMAKIDSRFNTEVGIPNVNIAKMSGVSDNEVNSNNIATQTKCELWLETMQQTITKVNKMFDLNISVSLRFKEQEVMPYESNVERDRTL